MIRKAFVMSVNPDQHEEYEKRHSPIWPELEEMLTEVASHLIPAGGKRLRPAFVIAAALSAHPSSEVRVRWGFSDRSSKSGRMSP